MTTTDIREEILDILSDIAPDEDLSNLDAERPFREQLELDSMDFPTSSWSCANGTASRSPRRTTNNWPVWPAPWRIWSRG
jgi:hypothetical protein